MHLFTHAIVFGRIIVLTQCTHCHIRDVTTAIDEQWQSTGGQKSIELHHRVEFLHNYYAFESVHDGNHNGIVKIFIGFPASCEVSLIIYTIVTLITLHNSITWHNFFPTRSIISSIYTPP